MWIGVANNSKLKVNQNVVILWNTQVHVYDIHIFPCKALLLARSPREKERLTRGNNDYETPKFSQLKALNLLIVMDYTIINQKDAIRDM